MALRVHQCLVLGLTLSVPYKAHALSCMPHVHSLAEAYEKADSIIVGMVTACEQTVSRDSWTSGGDGCSFVSLDVLKDASVPRDYGGKADSAGCGLSLHVGQQYLLFLGENNEVLTQFSRPLNDAQRNSGRLLEQVRVLREYRDGVAADLSDPWYFSDGNQACLISHQSGGNSFQFMRGQSSKWLQSDQGWTREVIDGKTVMRSSLGDSTAAGMLRTQQMEVIIDGVVPEGAENEMSVSISLHEPFGAVARDAVLQVNNRSWPLTRTEVRLGDTVMGPRFSYSLFGANARDVLDALRKPADIRVSATKLAERRPPPALEEQQGAPVLAPAPQGQVISEQDRKRYRDALRQRQMTRRSDRAYENAEPVVTFETRSTQLARVVDRFDDCVQGR